MKYKYLQIGSIKTKFRKLAVFSWHNIRKSGKSSLTDICKAVKQALRWLTKLNWFKLLKSIELIVKIVDKIRSLLFCDKKPPRSSKNRIIRQYSVVTIKIDNL